MDYNKDDNKTVDIDISGLFDDTSKECTSVYLLESGENNDKNKKVVTVYKSKSKFIDDLKKLK